MNAFMTLSSLTGIRLNEQDFFIEGHQENSWELYRTVSLRNGFDPVRLHQTFFSQNPIFPGWVTMNGEWPMLV
jgi:hypothetical protein